MKNKTLKKELYSEHKNLKRVDRKTFTIFKKALNSSCNKPCFDAFSLRLEDNKKRFLLMCENRRIILALKFFTKSDANGRVATYKVDKDLLKELKII